MSVSILVVDDEPDVADLFRQRFRRGAHEGTYPIVFTTARIRGSELRPSLIAMPGASRAQQKAIPVIDFLGIQFIRSFHRSRPRC